MFSSDSPFQAYTSQFVSLVMFGLMMCDDKFSMQERRRQIIQGLKKLPGQQKPGKLNSLLHNIIYSCICQFLGHPNY